MEQWNSIAIPLFRPWPRRAILTQNSFQLPYRSMRWKMIENGLIPFGLYGKRLATISAALILDMLKTPAVRSQIREGREKVTR
jgi:hypothetical protein